MTVRRPAHALGALSGLLAGAAGLFAGEGLAAALPGVTSPVVAVGNRFIVLTPGWLKDLAIGLFGTADKIVLLAGMGLVIAAAVAAIGALGVRRRALAAGLLSAMVAVAGLAAATDRAASAAVPLRLAPPLLAAAVGVGALVALLSRLPDGTAPAGAASGSAADGASTGRRGFLLAALATAAVGTLGGVASRVAGIDPARQRARVRLPRAATPAPPLAPKATLPVDGITPYLTSNADFYRIDTALEVPRIDLGSWRLRVTGMVDRELTWSYQELLERPLTASRITLTCVSNEVGGDLVGNATWLGVPLAELIAEAGPSADADAVLSTSVDGMTIGTPLRALTDDRGSLLAVGMNGEPLPPEHGFPARMVVPGLYGYVSATKWVTELEVSRFDEIDAYWTSRGYAEEAPIKMSSRIDVPRSFASLPRGRVPVAGVAWAQGTGVGRVDVRVDGGPWREARLAAPDNDHTWRQWVWEWDTREARAGQHTPEVRMIDADGAVPVQHRAPIAPDGSTGWDSVVVSVQA